LRRAVVRTRSAKARAKRSRPRGLRAPRADFAMAVDDARALAATHPAESENPARAYCSLRGASVSNVLAAETPPPSSSAVQARSPPLPLPRIRALFPAVSDPSYSLGYAFFENAGGTQVPRFVVDAVRARMVGAFAQYGAGYPHSNRADASADAAHAVVRAVMGVRAGDGDVAIGPSTTQLLANLARAFDGCVEASDEIVIQRASHEANASPWTRLARRAGAKVVWWNDADATWAGWEDGDGRKPLALDRLRDVVTSRTKIIAACHVSNVLGGVVDAREIVAVARERAHPSCRVVLDCVAYAPHKLMSVSDWGVDFCLFSPYKVFGPHCGALFGTRDAFRAIRDGGPNHYFVDPKAHAYKFELGGVPHETCAGLVGMGTYLRVLSGASGDHEEMTFHEPPPTREDVVVAFERIAALEREPQARLMAILRALEDEGLIEIHGPRTADQSARVPTAAFTPTARAASRDVEEVVAACRAWKIAARHGHVYAVRLLEDLGVNPTEGVVRISLAHYNTVDEVERLGKALDEALRGRAGDGRE